MVNSDNSESRDESHSSDEKGTGKQKRKHRLKRKTRAQTDGELRYTKNIQDFSAVDDLKQWICCTKCQVSFQQDIQDGKEIYSHPLLSVLMCKACCDYYGDGEFSLDEDNEDKYCRWCGEGGELFICSSCVCGFCPKCIKRHFGIQKVKEIKKDDDWLCYLCNPEPLWKLMRICELARKESELNRKKNNVPGSVKKGTSTKDKNSDTNQQSAKSNQDDKESRKNDSTAEADSDNSSRNVRRSSRFNQKQGKSGDVASSNSMNGESALRKRKIETNNVKDKRQNIINGRAKKRRLFQKDVFSTSSDSVSSDADESDVDETHPRNKEAVKLMEMLKVTEVTSEMCLKLCRKQLKKLERKNCAVPDRKLIPEYEKLKSVVILMSSSLSTVHNTILSLQKRAGSKGADSVFGGGDGTALLKTISHVLTDKRVKASQLVSVVVDVLNRYPYVELGATLNGEGLNESSPRGTPSTERLRYDSDVSTDVFESDNRSVAENDSKKDDFDEDVKKFRENSMKLRRELLKDSSEEEESDGREERALKRLMNLSTLERRRGKTDSSRETKRTGRKSLKTDGEEPESEEISVTSERGDETEVELPKPEDEAGFMKNCAPFLKEAILNTTSSESSDDDDDDSEDRKKKNRKREGKRTKRKDDSDWMSDSSTDVKDRRKRKHKKMEYSTSEDSSTDSFKPSRRKKRKTKVLTDSDGSSSAIVETPAGSKQTESPGKGRKAIRKILKKGSLQLETRQAIKMENERKKRIAERNECYKKFFPDMLNGDRLVLDFNRETGEPLVEVPKEIVRSLKPHQKEGVKFMWDNCFESMTAVEESSGSGCILAHCMGLGKTLQVIALLATVMNLGVDTVLILSPLNVVNNWVQEFDLWLKDVDIDIDIYNIVKLKAYDRAYHIRKWHKDGGVLVLSYDMLRNLTKPKEGRGTLRSYECLLDPGPDLVICDEGHVMKNEDTSLARSLMRIKTARRIILTGTPFQNNLLEYHSMVQFIKPNILGTRKEFMNRFANPIRNGQFEDSTAEDVKLMRARSHVLHKLLDGCIQRFNYSVLTPFLPEKHEYVISVRLTETQANLYRHYLEKCRNVTVAEKGTKLFGDFHWLQKVWTHPALVRSHMEEREARNDQEGDLSSNESVVCIEDDPTEKAYWKTVIKPEEYDDIRSSGKLLLLFDILQRCRRIGDKVLVFSQSLKNLNLIEDFLHEMSDTWVSGEDYFRMDGSTGSDTRTRWCKYFNSKNTRARLFLISTKAGGLGINLIGANRVVIFDASWNPSHDVQSIFRVYRFGQTKPCYIYRFVAEATMEEKIYERQVTKLSLEKRVLDEHQIERHYTMGNLQELYNFDPLPREKWPVPNVPKDMILAEILNVRRDVVVTYHEHDSLLENIEEEELTEEERKAAWEDFEKERFMIENQLQRSAFGRYNQCNRDELTAEVLRITGMYKASESNVPYFTPSVADGSGNGLPFKIVNVQSLVQDFSEPSTSLDI